jgi:hypothetical protein
MTKVLFVLPKHERFHRDRSYKKMLQDCFDTFHLDNPNTKNVQKESTFLQNSSRIRRLQRRRMFHLGKHHNWSTNLPTSKFHEDMLCICWTRLCQHKLQVDMSKESSGKLRKRCKPISTDVEEGLRSSVSQPHGK